MKHIIFVSTLLLTISLTSCKTETTPTPTPIPPQDLTQYVNTLIGTQPWSGDIQLAGSELAEGHTYPGVCPPFAMTEWTPQTTTGAIPYWHENENTKISGFRASHYPSGAVMSEYGSFTLFPSTGEIVTDPEKRASAIDLKSEIVKPHYYAVHLTDDDIKAEITATSRAGFLQFTFPKSESSYILLDLFEGKGLVEIHADKNEITGYSTARGLGTPDNFACYFVAIIDKSFIPHPDQGAIEFSSHKGEIVKAKIGTSFISLKQARKNLNSEIPHWDFEKTREQSKAAWNTELKKIQIEGGTDADKTIFYTAMYHALLLPREFSEQGKYYSPYDGKIHEGVSFTDYSLWDTYRAEHPLLIFLDPDQVNLMIQSLLNSYDEGGWMPKWPNPGYSSVMMGTHADALIADAYVKGLRDYNVDKAWEAMVKNANEPGTENYAARLGIKDYKYYGFVPGGKWGECVARTLEFAYDDFCLAQMAKAMGNEEGYQEYIQRANYYKNVLDPESRNVRGKRSDGGWMDVNDNSISVWAGHTDLALNIYKWNHSFLAPHDVEGLISFFGGEQEFIAALNNLFDNNYYYVGDEFSMHAPYLYNYASAPWKTQKLVRNILADYFRPDAGGLCGNDDCGQLSSWYIFGAIGFYPVAPGDDYYTIGSPLFDKVVMNLPNEKQFIVTSENNSSENVFIQSATLNNKKYTKSFITHDDIMNGGHLHFVMGDQPNEKWGTGKKNIPRSFIADYDYLPGPAINSSSTTFEDSLIVKLEALDPDIEIYYTLDKTDPDDQSISYSDPIVIKENTTIKAISYKSGTSPSVIMEAEFVKRPMGRSIQLLSNYSENYTGGGAEGLIDYLRGNTYFRSKRWQGYEENDLEAIIDLGTEQKVNTIGASFLQDIPNWIFFPKAIDYYGSKDGKHFIPIGTSTFDNSKRLQAIPQTKTFEVTTDQNLRYVKIIARNQRTCPAWHHAPGGKAWLFVDELMVNQ